MGQGGHGHRRAAIDGLAAVAAAAMALGTGAAWSQKFPDKPIRIITSAPGGTSDFTSRLVARGLTDSLGQQVIVDNRGNFGGDHLVKAPADGYTLLIDGASLWIAPLMQKTPYDPLRDFAPVTILTRAPTVVVVHPSLPVSSVKELIALAKAKPGLLNYGSGGIGGASHLPVELFKSTVGVNVVNVNYKGVGPAVNALLANEVQLMFINSTIATPHIAAGRLKALAVGSLQTSALFPELPTLAASGLPGFEAVIVLGALVPGRTPAQLIFQLNEEIARVLNRPDVKERHFNAGAETVGTSPEEFAATMRADIARWGKVIKSAGIRTE